jgi:hypothetical protein
METALIGLFGLLLGIAINETLRRGNRIENYAAQVFDKRLKIHEELYALVSVVGEPAKDVIENPNYSSKQRHGIVSAVIHEIANWCDKNEMYLSVELTLLCTPLLMGVEEIYDTEDSDEKQDLVTQFLDNLHNAKKMIRKESGIEDIEKMFSSITKPKHTSPIVAYYRKRKRELGVKGKWE